MAISDLTDNGNADLVVSNEARGTVSVLLGNGNGTFQAQQTFATGNNPDSVAIGDLSGDGIPDLVVANSHGESVSVLLGNGNGTFQAQQTFPTGIFPHSVAIADLSGDGIPDLVVANGIGNVNVLLGNGNGTFHAQQTFAAGNSPISVAVGDLNGDGKPDLVVANQGGGVSVLLGNGNGTFQAQQTFATGTNPISVAIGDVNGDGNPDLVVPNHNSNNVSVLLGNGNGTFQPQQTFAASAYPGGVVLADLNGDGKLDIANGSEAFYVSVLLNAANGNFTGQVYNVDSLLAPLVQSINRTNPASPATNASTVTFTVTLSQAVPGLVASDFQLVVGGLVGVTLTQLTPLSASVYTVTVSGITGNGTLGLNCFTFTGQAYTINTVAPFVQSINRNVPTGPVTDASTVSYTVTFSEAVTGVGAADFQLALSGTLATTLTQVTPVSGSVYTVTISGITGNGTLGLDLVDNGSIHDLAGNALTQQNAAPAFQAQQTVATGFAPNSFALGDLTGDGKADLVFVSHNSATLNVLLGNGNGTFQTQQGFATGSNPYAVAVAM